MAFAIPFAARAVVAAKGCNALPISSAAGRNAFAIRSIAGCTSFDARSNAATLAPMAFPAAVRACETRRSISPRGAPHTEQYLCPDGNSEPHLAQFIPLPRIQ